MCSSKTVVFFITMALVTLVGCQQGTWKEFSSTEGAFLVLMPGTPTMDKQTASTAVGPIDSFTFTLEETDGIYTVSYADYPEDIVRQNEPDDMLDSVRTGAIGSIEGSRLLNESSILFGEYPGRDLEIEAPDGKSTLHIRAILVDNRLYSLMVVSIGKQPSTSDIQKFFESFTLLEQ